MWLNWWRLPAAAGQTRRRMSVPVVPLLLVQFMVLTMWSYVMGLAETKTSPTATPGPIKGCGCTANGTVKYSVTVQTNWTVPAPPTSTSQLFGFSWYTTHTACFRLWQHDGDGNASFGVRQLLIDGTTTAIRSETLYVQPNVLDARQDLDYLEAHDATHGIELLADRLRPFFSFILPIRSTDWFTGVDSIRLCDGDRWKNLTLPLYAWDAGIDDNVNYTYSPLPTLNSTDQPSELIALLSPNTTRSTLFHTGRQHVEPIAHVILTPLAVTDPFSDPTVNCPECDQLQSQITRPPPRSTVASVSGASSTQATTASSSTTAAPPTSPPVLDGCQCQASSVVRYRLDIVANWTVPRAPHSGNFGFLVAASHDQCYRMWQVGQDIGIGADAVAELGNSTKLVRELLAAGLHVRDVLTGSAYQAVVNATEVCNITVDRFRPFVSLMRNIYYSPDWFVGASAVNLCAGDQWQNVSIPLYPYDAGTDSSTSIVSFTHKATSPPQPVALLYPNTTRSVWFHSSTRSTVEPLAWAMFTVLDTLDEYSGPKPNCSLCSSPTYTQPTTAASPSSSMPTSSVNVITIGGTTATASHPAETSSSSAHENTTASSTASHTTSGIEGTTGSSSTSAPNSSPTATAYESSSAPPATPTTAVPSVSFHSSASPSQTQLSSVTSTSSTGHGHHHTTLTPAATMTTQTVTNPTTTSATDAPSSTATLTPPATTTTIPASMPITSPPSEPTAGVPATTTTIPTPKMTTSPPSKPTAPIPTSTLTTSPPSKPTTGVPATNTRSQLTTTRVPVSPSPTSRVMPVSTEHTQPVSTVHTTSHLASVPTSTTARVNSASVHTSVESSVPTTNAPTASSQHASIQHPSATSPATESSTTATGTSSMSSGTSSSTSKKGYISATHGSSPTANGSSATSSVSSVSSSPMTMSGSGTTPQVLENHGSSAGIIAGAVVGVVLVLGISLVLFCYIKRPALLFRVRRSLHDRSRRDQRIEALAGILHTDPDHHHQQVSGEASLPRWIDNGDYDDDDEVLVTERTQLTLLDDHDLDLDYDLLAEKPSRVRQLGGITEEDERSQNMSISL
ncbi:mucin-5AC-like [Sycon ciliatum]|uniref:mucin-5AC-like n=1 Tax=Sycon ciliatum TaxID=27933 RepID=UPI0031F66F28